MSEEHQYDFDEEEVTTTDEPEAEVEEEEQDGKEPEVKPESAKPEEEEDSTFLDFDKPETITPDRVKARIQAETRRKYEQEKELRRLREEREKLERELLELKKPKEVQPPSVDLAIDDAEEFQRQNQAYLEAQRAREKWEAEQAERERKAEEAKALEQQQKEAALIEKAEKHGVTRDKLQRDARIVGDIMQHEVPRHTEADANRQKEIMDYILDHDYAYRLLGDFATNPSELQDLMNLSTAKAVEKISEKSLAYKQSLKSKAPPPDEPLRGNGAPPQTDPWLSGATFE